MSTRPLNSEQCSAVLTPNLPPPPPTQGTLVETKSQITHFLLFFAEKMKKIEKCRYLSSLLEDGAGPTPPTQGTLVETKPQINHSLLFSAEEMKNIEEYR